MTRLLPLAQALDVRRCGGKATALARCQAAGLPVPDSLVLPADTPDATLPALAEQILAWANGRAPHGLVARSSATGEDSNDFSFAGLFTTRFAPATTEALGAALAAVRASAASHAATAYAHARRTSGGTGMAVLIQPALRPYASGVVAAELTARRCARWRIEAVWGLAQPLVAGELAGEAHTDADTDANTTPAEQPVILLPGTAEELRQPPGEWIILPRPGGPPAEAKIKTSDGGLLRIRRPDPWKATPILNAAHRHAVLHLAAEAGTALDLDRIDIEWALLPNGNLLLLQARPLTAPLTTSPRAATEPGTALWRGIPAAPGTGTGPATRLDDNQDPHDTVLICGPLGPEAVDALLQGPAAVISTRGGPLSHTAILARELGIPCVTAVRDALTAIPPGTLLHVDGAAGTVRSLADGPLPPQRTAPRDAATEGAAVLAWHPPTTPPGDRRAATILLHTPDTGPLANLLDQARTSPGTTGILLTHPHTPPAPAGYRTINLPGTGRLLWPEDAAAPPNRLLALHPDGHTLHQRLLTTEQP